MFQITLRPLIMIRSARGLFLGKKRKMGFRKYYALAKSFIR